MTFRGGSFTDIGSASWAEADTGDVNGGDNGDGGPSTSMGYTVDGTGRNWMVVTAGVIFSDVLGPHTWPSGAAGRRQSPVNVRSECVQQVDGCPPLLWPGYDVLPCKLSLSNDGTAGAEMTVLCRGHSAPRHRSSTPALSGGPLGEGCWPFAWAEFHWGPSDDEGSEHTLDYCRYALELQVVHGPCEGAQYEYVCVAVLFEAVMEDNPYLDPVVQALHQVRRPGCCTHLLPFPLDWLSPPMEQSYLSYCGSLTRPPCSEGVLWILRPHPLTISSRQVPTCVGVPPPVGLQMVPSGEEHAARPADARPPGLLLLRLTEWSRPTASLAASWKTKCPPLADTTPPHN
ncbi:carbonic anhydrase 1-like [Schistocerca nitens]|uniref:carbonic anhydrase 1-like n=1 Tax=Schistocerca nitens TaxID=7011 RepID=UPI0021188A6E|nr:carbonic anhydrase 1-like [Schistocerca nitens]